MSAALRTVGLMTQQDGDTPDAEPTLAGTAGPTQAPEPGTERPASAPEKDPKDWATGDEPMTGPQRT
jgi:hypothetical protein